MTHPSPSAANIRSMLMLCLLPFALSSLVTAADDPEPRVVDPGKPGGAPSDAIVLFDGKDLSKFRGKNSDAPNWKLENGVMETIPGGDANGMFSRDLQEHGCKVRYRSVWVRKLNL